MNRLFIAFIAAFFIACFLLIMHANGEVDYGHAKTTANITSNSQTSVASNHVPWKNNPFEAMDCFGMNRERIRSTACDPHLGSLGNSLSLDELSPVDKAKFIVGKFEEREFDKLPTLLLAFKQCWSDHSRVLSSKKSPSQEINIDCDMKSVLRYVGLAENILFSAASQGDYIAREAYVDLLLTKFNFYSDQLEFYRHADMNSENVNDLQNSNVNELNKIVVFIKSLKDPSESLLDILLTVDYKK